MESHSRQSVVGDGFFVNPGGLDFSFDFSGVKCCYRGVFTHTNFEKMKQSQNHVF
jgi:hypothetical protein